MDHSNFFICKNARELIHNRGATHVKKLLKIFSENNTYIGVKACRKFEFDIYEAKNASLIQERPVY
jgi:hypothetical protein